MLVEGIESSQSATVQADIPSYSADDIVFDHVFEQCAFEDDSDAVGDSAGITIDFTKFHSLRPVEQGGA